MTKDIALHTHLPTNTNNNNKKNRYIPRRVQNGESDTSLNMQKLPREALFFIDMNNIS